MDELERIEVAAVLDFFAAATPEIAAGQDLAVLDLDGAVAFSWGALPTWRLFNRVVGLESDSRLPEAEAFFASRKCSFAISLTPESRLADALRRRGYEPTDGSMKFRRGVEPAPEASTSLRVDRIGTEGAEEFGAVLAKAFELGQPVGRWHATLPTRHGWACFGAFDDRVLVATAMAYFADNLGWLGAAGTMPAARGRGAQSALLAARIRAAAEAGVEVLAVETDIGIEGDAGVSHRNVLRAGFQPAYVQQWWVRPQGMSPEHQAPS